MKQLRQTREHYLKETMALWSLTAELTMLLYFLAQSLVSSGKSDKILYTGAGLRILVIFSWALIRLLILQRPYIFFVTQPLNQAQHS